jgi:hypothetical protein
VRRGWKWWITKFVNIFSHTVTQRKWYGRRGVSVPLPMFCCSLIGDWRTTKSVACDRWIRGSQILHFLGNNSCFCPDFFSRPRVDPNQNQILTHSSIFRFVSSRAKKKKKTVVAACCRVRATEVRTRTIIVF